MNQYRKYGVRLPLDASARIEDVSRRTGIQKAVLLRSIILRWVESECGALPTIDLAGSDQAAPTTYHRGVTADEP
jgi:hypothetical protein